MIAFSFQFQMVLKSTNCRLLLRFFFLFFFVFFAVELTNFRTTEKIPVRSSVQESQKEKGLIFCLCVCVFVQKSLFSIKVI